MKLQKRKIVYFQVKKNKFEQCLKATPTSAKHIYCKNLSRQRTLDEEQVSNAIL